MKRRSFLQALAATPLAASGASADSGVILPKNPAILGGDAQCSTAVPVRPTFEQAYAQFWKGWRQEERERMAWADAHKLPRSRLERLAVDVSGGATQATIPARLE